MGTVYGVNKTKLLSPIGSNILDGGLNKAKVVTMYDTYEASALAAGSVIKVCDKIPVGAIVTRIDVVFDDLGTGNTIDVGDALDVDRYVDGADVATAASSASFPNATCIAGVGYQIVDTGVASTSSNQIQITVLGAAATGTIKVLVQYAI